MAIAVDAISNGNGFASSNNNTTWSHTCTGSNLILFVAVEVAGDSNLGRVSSVTYNGVALTKYSEVSQTLATSNSSVGLWYLINPPTGTHTVSVTTGVNVPVLCGCSASYNGVSQIGFPDGNHNDTATSAASFTSVVTSTTANAWHVAAVLTPGPTTAGANTTRRCSNEAIVGNICIMDGNAAISSPGSDTLNINIASPFQTGQDDALGVTIAPTAITTTSTTITTSSSTTTTSTSTSTSSSTTTTFSSSSSSTTTSSSITLTPIPTLTRSKAANFAALTRARRIN